MEPPPAPDPPSQAAPLPPPPSAPPDEPPRPPPDINQVTAPAAVPKCAFCGGNPDGDPPDDVMERAREARRNRPLSEKERARMALELGRQEHRRRGVLGPLLGPLSEKVGLAGVWVHRECAIWSPEVYFADSGHLKNVAAAVRRGRLLRCVFCQRGGPTMGCWIERCPKSYHLACARADGCHFNHADYLITCHDHAVHRPKRHRLAPGVPPEQHKRARPWPLPLPVPEPQPEEHPPEGGKRARRAAAVAAVQRISITARQDAEREAARGGDLAADEAEFLRRERRRLQRDLARIAPVRLGGGEPGAEATQGGPPGWESVAGLRHVVDCLKEMVVFPLLYPEAFARLGGGPPRGVLLHGHPGTGKTLVARALAGACSRGPHQVAFFARKGADCLGKYVGDAERQLRLLFQVAAASAPSIIFFDEMDGLAPARQVTASDQTHASVVATLLALLDGATPRGAVVVIAATNRPDAIDPALRRPGRFDREIFFPLPSLPDRAAILRVHTSAWPSPPPPATLQALAKATPGYAGADLAALAAQAAVVALKRSLGGGIPDTLTNGPPLPPVHVTANDWARALAAAPSPASRRSCQALLATPACTPLSAPLVPLLGPPLASLLLALHQDGRVGLPNTARVAAEAVAAALSTSSFPLPADPPTDEALWDWASASERAAVRALLETGVLPNPGGYQPGTEADWSNDDTTPRDYTGAGVRVLMHGDGAVGQEALVGALVALLEGGEGEVHSASLGAMMMAGHGDPVQGLSHILSNVRGRRATVLVMPRLESWATVQVPPLEENEGASGSVVASAAWKMFLQQMGGAPTTVPALILATAGVPSAALPPSVSTFFGNSSPVSAGRAQSNGVPNPQPEQGLSKGASWQLGTGASGGAVGCFRVALAGGDPPREASMLRWAAHRSAAALANTCLRQERARRQPAAEKTGAGADAGNQGSGGDPKRKREPSVGASPEEGGTEPQPTSTFSNGKVVDDVPGMSMPGSSPPEPAAEPEPSPPEANVFPGGSPAVGDAPPQKRARLPPLGEGSLQEKTREGATAAALRWCGRQLLSDPQWSCLRRASAPVTWDKEAKRRPFEVPRAIGSPAPGGGVPVPPPSRDATPPPPSGGLIGVARTACSGGFSTAAELSAAVGRVLTRVRRREEGERMKRRRIEVGGDAEQEEYPPLLAAAAALQDTVAAWEYALERKEAAAGKSRSIVGEGGLQRRGEETRREGSVPGVSWEREGELGYPGKSAEQPNLGNLQADDLAVRTEGDGKEAGESAVRNEAGEGQAGLATGGHVSNGQADMQMERTGEGQGGVEPSGRFGMEAEMERAQRDSQTGPVEGTEILLTEPEAGLVREQLAVKAGAAPSQGERHEAGLVTTSVELRSSGEAEGPGIEGRPETTSLSAAKEGPGTARAVERETLGPAREQIPQSAAGGTREEPGPGQKEKKKGVHGGDWWAPECFSQLAEAILEKYRRERERHGAGAEELERAKSACAASKNGEKQSSVNVESILEVVATTNRHVQAGLAGIQKEAKVLVCLWCKKHFETLVETEGIEASRPVCLEPLRNAVQHL